MVVADPVAFVSDAEDVEIPALEAAATHTARELDRFEGLGESLPETPEGIGVVLTGSFARAEVTPGSDCDFLVLVERVDDHVVVPNMVQEVNDLVDELEYEPPGSQGVFGDFALTQELVARIGLDADSNTNLTRRMLLLFESVSVYGSDVRDRAIRQLLDRYCHDYHPDIRTKDVPPSTARFLLNDLIRYWRTVTVDFGAKQWRSGRRDWYLRYAKLLTTRKILFAGSLATLLTIGRATVGRDKPGAYEALLGHLTEHIELTPLARLMTTYEHIDEPGRTALGGILGSYEAFQSMLNDTTTRAALKRAGNLDTDDDREIHGRVLGLGEGIQGALEKLFYGEEIFSEMTPKYGLF